MPKNEDGEFELVLGNRQLLSVFFIVVALMGVFFAIGYILGRNSGPMTSEIASTKKAERPLVVDSPVRDSNPAATSPTVKKEAEQQPKPEKSKPSEPAHVEQPKPEPAKTKAPEPIKSGPAVSRDLASGTYLQLTATSEHEATVYVDVLRKKGFKAQSAEVPEKHGLFRVLVGPVADSNVNKTKADLQTAGFPGDQAIRRTF